MIDKTTVKMLSDLCRIDCPPDDAIDALCQDLNVIVDYVDSLKEVDTESVPACSHVLGDIVHSMREDQDDPSFHLDRKTFLKNSPDHIGGMIRVPPVIRF